MMNVGNLQQSPTYHGTVVFPDVESSKLPLGKTESSPRNVFLGLRERAAYLVHAPADGEYREIRIVSDSAPTQIQLRDTPSDSPQAWLFAEVGGSCWSVQRRPLICVRREIGKVTLSLPRFGVWEQFSLQRPASPTAVTNLNERGVTKARKIGTSEAKLCMFRDRAVERDRHGPANQDLSPLWAYVCERFFLNIRCYVNEDDPWPFKWEHCLDLDKTVFRRATY